MILRVISYTISTIFTLFRFYIYYRGKFRKYVKKVKNSMIRKGIPRKMVKRLCESIQPLRIRDFVKYRW